MSGFDVQGGGSAGALVDARSGEVAPSVSGVGHEAARVERTSSEGSSVLNADADVPRAMVPLINQT